MEPRRDVATLLLVLDEAANISPLPSLAGLLTSGAGDGIQVLFALQEPGQAMAWGDDRGAVLHGSRLLALFPGLRDAEYLSQLASLAQNEIEREAKTKQSAIEAIFGGAGAKAPRGRTASA